MASKNISFEQIKSSTRKPGVNAEFNYKLAVRTLPGNRQETLLIGQKTATGTLPVNTPVEVYSDDEAAVYFGYGSVGHLMVRSALETNRYLAVSIIAQDDAAAGVAATKTVTLANNAGGVGVETINIGSRLVQIAVASGDTPTERADALVAEAAKQPELPMSLENVAGVITLTAKNKGECGNDVKVSASTTAAGTTMVVAAGVTGDVNPDVDDALTAVFAHHYDIIACPYVDVANVTKLRDYLNNVSGPYEQRYAIGTTGHIGTLAQATTFAASINGRRVFPCLVPNAYETSYEVSASYAALIASEEDPARPLNTLHLKSISASPLNDRLGRTEQESCLYNGVTPTEVGPGNRTQVVRAVSSYVLNAAGIPDESGLDITTQRSLDYTATAVVQRLALRFPRDKKTKRVKNKVRSEIIDVLYKLEELEIVENVDDNVPDILVEDDLQNPGMLDIKIPADVVNGLHNMGIRIDLLL